MLGYSGENGPLSDDRSNFLPVSTKTSTEDENSENGSEKLNNSFSLSSRNLPPIYVDIQEEVEQNLTQIDSKGKPHYHNDHVIYSSRRVKKVASETS